MTPQTHDIEPAQARYANVLEHGVRLGFVVLLASFIAYVTGMLPAYVPLERLPQLWRLPSKAYLAATGTSAGWDWLRHIAHGEFASVAGVVILAAVPAICLAAVAVEYHRHRDRTYLAITIAIIIVIATAVSGVFNRLH